jgi:TatD DNase family protein
MLIDSHCHLADQVFIDDLDEVVARAGQAGVDGALCILAADDTTELARRPVVRSVWPSVRFAAGIHPHRAGDYAGRLDDVPETLAQAMTGDDVIAVGEIGLDYHYDFAPAEVQREVFTRQVQLARAAGRPVIIHAREAMDDTVAILRDGGVRGVMHCFTGTVDDARRALDLGFYVSFSGIITFPKSGALREVAAFVPGDRLLVETDAPFLAPVPHRGRRNEPGYVAETFQALARLRSVPPAELLAQVAANTIELLPELRAVHVR